MDVTPAPQAPTTPPPATADGITTQVLGVVAEKTGYPQEMLDPELDMEADLGIDTVKQAETFASIRERFEIPAQEGLSLRDYPTLQSVIDFVKSMRPELVGRGARGGGRTRDAVIGRGDPTAPPPHYPNRHGRRHRRPSPCRGGRKDGLPSGDAGA
ncbi:MAG: hypothetical protein H6644_01845 [Caldilineaceae bacterium]|nr:hypothetical protein [Caldilineaceae bacterium]